MRIIRQYDESLPMPFRKRRDDTVYVHVYEYLLHNAQISIFSLIYMRVFYETN